MNTMYVTHATKQSKKLLDITLHFTQSYFCFKTSLMLGPHQSPIYFCMNQFHKFHHLKL